MIFFSASQQFYKLVNCWTLDGENDTHVCNDPKRFQMEKLTDENDFIINEKSTHKIKAFEMIDITTKNFKKLLSIRLLNVVFIIEYFINLIYLDRFEEKGIFHDSKNSRLQRKKKTFCWIKKVGRHKIIEYNSPYTSEANKSFGVFVSSFFLLSILQTTGAEWHFMLRHPGSEVISNLEKLITNVQMLSLESASSTIHCEVCAFIKAHKLISRRTGHEELFDSPFEKTGFDLIQQITSYNENNWVFYFTCLYNKAEFIYTHFKKNNVLETIKIFLKIIRTRYDQTVRFFGMNDKQTLNEKFDALITSYEIIQKRTTSYTLDQNGNTKQFKKLLTIKIKTMRISSRLCVKMWSKTYKIVEYVSNCTSKKF